MEFRAVFAAVVPRNSASPADGAADRRIRFDRNELAGAFGDIGTDLPLLVGVILAAGLNTASALVMFGALQILTGPRYRMPMPVQPLKAMAALVIAHQVSGTVLAGGGLAIGVLLLVEGLTLMRLVRDLVGDSHGLIVALLVGVIAVSVPYGYGVALVVGCAAAWLPRVPGFSFVGSGTR